MLAGILGLFGPGVPMFLSLTTTIAPATDLGFLLHKNPSSVRSVPLWFGQAHIFFPEAT